MNVLLDRPFLEAWIELGVYAIWITFVGLLLSKKKFDEVLYLLFGTLYGLMLEIITVFVEDGYHYQSSFYVMVGSCPLWIGVSWGCILWACSCVTRVLLDASTPTIVVALCDAFLALLIDLPLDPIASEGLGFWQWAPGEVSARLFGVPLGNFWAWGVVICSFSYFSRRFFFTPFDQPTSSSSSGHGGALLKAAVLAFACSLLTLSVSVRLYVMCEPYLGSYLEAVPLLLAILVAGFYHLILLPRIRFARTGQFLPDTPQGYQPLPFLSISVAIPLHFYLPYIPLFILHCWDRFAEPQFLTMIVVACWVLSGIVHSTAFLHTANNTNEKKKKKRSSAK